MSSESEGYGSHTCTAKAVRKFRGSQGEGGCSDGWEATGEESDYDTRHEKRKRGSYIGSSSTSRVKRYRHSDYAGVDGCYSITINSELLNGGKQQFDGEAASHEEKEDGENSMAVEWSSDDSNGERLAIRDDDLPITSNTPTQLSLSAVLAFDGNNSKIFPRRSAKHAYSHGYYYDNYDNEECNEDDEDDEDNDYSIATSLFVEVASVDECGSYHGYGAASETEKQYDDADDDEGTVDSQTTYYELHAIRNQSDAENVASSYNVYNSANSNNGSMNNNQNSSNNSDSNSIPDVKNKNRSSSSSGNNNNNNNNSNNNNSSNSSFRIKTVGVYEDISGYDAASEKGGRCETETDFATDGDYCWEEEFPWDGGSNNETISSSDKTVLRSKRRRSKKLHNNDQITSTS